MDKSHQQWRMGHTHGEHVFLPLCVQAAAVSCDVWLTVCTLASGEPEVWYQHPVLENHWDTGGGEDGQACAAEEHPNRR